MKRSQHLLGALIVAIVGVGSAYAIAPGDRVKNFTLPDLNGKMRELYKLSDKKAVVFMTQGNGCPIVRQAVPALREIRDQYAARGVEFFLVNSNLQDTAQTVTEESKEFAFDMPIWLDNSQKVGEALGVERTAEVFVIDPKTWQLKFHGPIDDRLSYERQRPVHHRYLADALDSVLAGKPVAVKTANSPGCLINFPNRH